MAVHCFVTMIDRVDKRTVMSRSDDRLAIPCQNQDRPARLNDRRAALRKDERELKDDYYRILGLSYVDRLICHED